MLRMIHAIGRCLPGMKSSESTRGTNWLPRAASKRARRLAKRCLYRLKSCGLTSGSKPGGNGGTTRESSMSARHASGVQDMRRTNFIYEAVDDSARSPEQSMHLEGGAGEITFLEGPAHSANALQRR